MGALLRLGYNSLYIPQLFKIQIYYCVLQCSAVQCNVVQVSTVRCRAIAQYIALLYCHEQKSFSSDLFPPPNPIARRLPRGNK